MSPTGLRASTGTSPGWSDSASSTMAEVKTVGSLSGSREHAAVRAATASATVKTCQMAAGRTMRERVCSFKSGKSLSSCGVGPERCPFLKL